MVVRVWGDQEQHFRVLENVRVPSLATPLDFFSLFCTARNGLCWALCECDACVVWWNRCKPEGAMAMQQLHTVVPQGW